MIAQTPSFLRKTVGAAALLAMVAGAPALAAPDGENADLSERVAALEATVSRLTQALERAQSQLAAASPAKVEEPVAVRETPPGSSGAAAGVSTPVGAQTPPQEKPSNGFKVGDTTLNIYGFIEVDTSVSSYSDGSLASNSIARDFYIPGATPVGGDGSSSADITAQATRFGITVDRDVAGDKLSGLVEMDFLGSVQGNEVVTNSYSPRLRRAFLDYDGWRVGQEWSTFQNTSAIPQSASLLTLSDGMIFIRQPQIRYSHGPFQLALENPETTVTRADGTKLDLDSNYVPDGVLRYNFTGGFGNLSAAVLLRQLRMDEAGVEGQALGYGLSLSGRVSTWGRDDIRFNLVGGEGVGRYVGINAIAGAALNPVSGDIEAIPSFGGYIAYHHSFSDVLSGNVGYSGLFANNPDFLGASVTESVQSVYASLMWDVVEDLSLGGEVIFGRREIESGESGTLSRVTVSTKYKF